MVASLTSLDRCKEWLGAKESNADALIRGLIGPASQVVLNYCDRADFAWQSITEIYDGPTRNYLVLRQWPVTDVVSIAFDGVTVTAQATGNPPTNGWQLTPPPRSGGNQRLTLFGYAFYPGVSNVEVTYHAGYRVVGEARTVPAATPFTIDPEKFWIGDLSVTYASGAALTKVTGTPTAGQYAVDEEGVYTFAAADAGAAVLLTYSNVPDDVEQATRELVGERYRARSRIGLVTETSGQGLTVAYSQKDMNDFIKASLQNYRNVVPGA